MIRRIRSASSPAAFVIAAILSVPLLATIDLIGASIVHVPSFRHAPLARPGTGPQQQPAPKPVAPGVSTLPNPAASQDPQRPSIRLQHRGEKHAAEANPFNVQFHDVTRESGIHFHHERAQSDKRLYLETMGAGVAWIDYNQDGYLDAFFVNSGFTPFFHPASPAEPPQPALYRNNGDGTFTDVTTQSKIRSDGTFFFGVAVGDFDNDGFPDIYMTGYRHSLLLHNNGDGTFTDVTEKAGVGNDGNWGTAAGWFDYDRDGLLDLLVTNYVQYDVDHPITCGDFRPGYKDIPHVSSYCHPDNFPGTSPRLYHNNGDGTFTDVTEKAGLLNKDGKSLAVVLADLNNDGWPDIFIANDTQRNFLYLNKQDGTFKDATYSSGAGFSEEGRPEAGMSADAADVMNNGLMYLFVSHLDYELNRLYRNNGDGTFTDYTIASGIGQSDLLNSAFGAKFFDFDNDGWRDLLVINGHILDNIALYHPEVKYEEEKKLYRNIGEAVFVDATRTQGPDFRAPRVGRGLAVGDYNNDGYLDFLVNNNGQDAQLFRNDGGNPTRIGIPTEQRGRGAGAPAEDSRSSLKSQIPNLKLPSDNPAEKPAQQPENSGNAISAPPAKNHWLAIRLIGTKSNRDGNGAHIKLTAGDLTSYDQSKGGMSYCSSQDPRIFFGLGAHERVDSIEIWWPSGLSETLKNVPADRFLTVTEGASATLRTYPPKP
jgi:enediyne biosynthesis protein E4